MKDFLSDNEDFLKEHKKGILIGAGAIAFVSSLAIGTGIHFCNGEAALDRDKKDTPSDNHLEASAEVSTAPAEGIIVDETDDLGDFIMPEKIIEDGKDYVTLRLPAGYALYLVDKEKGVGMLGVDFVDGYNIYTGPNGSDLEGYVGIKDTLKYMIGAANTMNAAIRAGKYEAVAAQKPELAPRGVKAPVGYVLYHPPGEDGTGIDLIGNQIFSDTDQGIIHTEEGQSLDGYVLIPGSYAEMLMSADRTLTEMEDFYYGHYSKAIN